MLRKCLTIGLALILLTTLGGVIGCGGGGSPSAVVKTYYTAINAGDFDKAEECLPPGSTLAEFYHRLAGKIERIEILDEQIYEVFGVEVAEVTVKVTLTPAGKYEMGGLELPRGVVLEKRKSGWKIVF